MKEKNTIDKLIYILLPIETILLQYKVLFINIGVIILFILLIIKAVREKRIFFDKSFLFFIFLFIIQQILSVFILDGNLNITTPLLIFFTASIFLYDNIDKKKVYKYFIIIGLILCLPVFIQSISVYVFKNTVNAIRLFPQAQENLKYWNTYSNRPMGFFTEPQTCCSYLIPFVIIAFYNNKKIISAVISLAIMLTGSSLGIATIVLIWGMFMLKSNIKSSRKIIIIICLIVFAIYFLMADFFANTRLKIASIAQDFSYYSKSIMKNSFSYSNYARIMKGWITYKELPMIVKVIGTGIAGFRWVSPLQNIDFSWSSIWNQNSKSGNLYYYSSMSGVFIECGLILGLIYYVFILKKYRNGDYIGKLLIIALIFQSNFSQTFFNGIFALYIYVYYATNDKTERIKIKF